jgi:acetyl/propionyl-CoA carboxylase alpha subunit
VVLKLHYCFPEKVSPGSIDVTSGQAMTKWQKLLRLVAIRMEYSLTAPFDGVVANLPQRLGTAAGGDLASAA